MITQSQGQQFFNDTRRCWEYTILLMVDKSGGKGSSLDFKTFRCSTPSSVCRIWLGMIPTRASFRGYHWCFSWTEALIEVKKFPVHHSIWKQQKLLDTTWEHVKIEKPGWQIQRQLLLRTHFRTMACGANGEHRLRHEHFHRKYQYCMATFFLALSSTAYIREFSSQNKSIG